MPRGPHFAVPSAFALVLAAAFVGGGGVLFVGCGTDAVGIEACRAIEQARCEAAPACAGDDDDLGIVTEEQVQNCITFYRDHCLVGLEDVEAGDPDEDQIDGCVAAVTAAGACAADGKATMAECKDPDTGDDVLMQLGLAGLSPCQALKQPEAMKACEFIVAEPPGSTSATTAETTTTTGGDGGGGAGAGGGGGGG